MPMTVATAATEYARLANSSSRSNGAAERRSASTNRTRNSAASTNPAITPPLCQPLVGPWMTAYNSANNATAMVICPGQSSERPSGAAEFRANRTDTPMLISDSTMTATNAHRQPAYGSLPKP